MTSAPGYLTFTGDWQILDSADHYFKYDTTVEIDWAAAPAVTDNPGAGWWINLWNDTGYEAVNCFLGRDSSGNQQVSFYEHSVTVPVACGQRKRTCVSRGAISY